MSSISIHSAAQVLRPPAEGLPHLRDPSGLTLEPGGLTMAAGAIATMEQDPFAPTQVDATGCAVLPGLVDCHTHVPFAGWRAEEYEKKVTGVPYEEIARAGGGIAASARALAGASDGVVLRQAKELAAEMLAHGTTAFECKSGYGLSVEGEMRALRLAAKLRDDVPQTLRSTALLAHAVPPGTDADAWMDEVEGMLPAVLARTAASALDIYVESIAFNNLHLERMGKLAAGHDLDLRCHVEQFATHRSIPTALAAGARSVDHLACLHPDDLQPLAEAECAAVLLPGAEFLGAEQVAPGHELAAAGAICVLATDANPGTSPVLSLPLIVGLAVRRYGWSVKQALAAVTLNAAWVLRLHDRLGTLEPGKRADVVLLDGPVEHIPYRFGHNPVAAAWTGGKLAYVRPDQAWRIA
jgi:imidazolonepropionase